MCAMQEVAIQAAQKGRGSGGVRHGVRCGAGRCFAVEFSAREVVICAMVSSGDWQRKKVRAEQRGLARFGGVAQYLRLPACACEDAESSQNCKSAYHVVLL
jgi:hypothetical protein